MSEEKRLEIEGMTCAACVRHVEKAVSLGNAPMKVISATVGASAWAAGLMWTDRSLGAGIQVQF